MGTDYVSIDTTNTRLTDALTQLNVPIFDFDGTSYVHVNEMNNVTALICFPIPEVSESTNLF